VAGQPMTTQPQADAQAQAPHARPFGGNRRATIRHTRVMLVRPAAAGATKGPGGEGPAAERAQTNAPGAAPPSRPARPGAGRLTERTGRGRRSGRSWANERGRFSSAEPPRPAIRRTFPLPALVP